MSSYLIDDVDILVRHLLFRIPGISPLKLHKSLYFLFAYYGSFYGNMSIGADNLSENHTSYPSLLFPELFQADKYGPEIRTVKEKFRNGTYQPEEIDSAIYPEEVICFLGELISQLRDVSDFALVERSHQDKVWRKFYEMEDNTMNPVEIISEYAYI